MPTARSPCETLSMTCFNMANYSLTLIERGTECYADSSASNAMSDYLLRKA
jgi:hypothetical protein